MEIVLKKKNPIEIKRPKPTPQTSSIYRKHMVYILVDYLDIRPSGLRRLRTPLLHHVFASAGEVLEPIYRNNFCFAIIRL